LLSVKTAKPVEDRGEKKRKERKENDLLLVGIQPISSTNEILKIKEKGELIVSTFRCIDIV